MALDGKTLGLALSGGGFRATLFGLGSLWRLSDALEHVPTRLSRFGAERQGHLINWGYALCDVSLRARVGLQLPMAAFWPVPEWSP